MSASAPADRPLRRNREALILVAVGGFTSAVRWLEMLAIGVFVFDRTGSAFLVAAMTLLRMLPLALFGAFVGAWAERLRRRPVLLVALALMVLLSLLLAALASGDRIAVWHLGVASFISGVFWSLDFPVRRTLVSDVVTTPRVASAMSLDVLTNNGSRMLGPLLGGALLQAVGLAGTFVLAAATYALSLACMLALRHRETPRGGQGSVLAALAEGLRYLRGHRALTGILMITVIFNLFGFPYLSLVPVIGREALALSASAIGLMASLEGAGVLVGASALMLWARPRHYRRYYVGGLSAFLFFGMLFAQSPWPVLSAALLLGAGIGGAGFASMQATLVLLCSEPAARSRMMGVLLVCIGTAPLGLLHLGWLADLLGAPAAISIACIEGLVAIAVVTRVWPEVLAPQPVD